VSGQVMIKGGGKVPPESRACATRCPQYCRAEPLIDRFSWLDYIEQ